MKEGFLTFAANEFRKGGGGGVLSLQRLFVEKLNPNKGYGDKSPPKEEEAPVPQEKE